MIQINKAIGLLFVNVIGTIFLLVVLEGISGWVLVTHHAVRVSPIAERAHTEYDSEIGWINLPNAHVANMYGPGVGVTTNSQRFRNMQDFTRDVPEGKARLICSGDSFTFGYGVADEETWCHQLSLLSERLQTVNLGQGGYGFGQAYLWYLRNEHELEHDIYVLAFISDDFRRMLTDNLWGYGKPVLTRDEHGLHVNNVPVPRRMYSAPKAYTFLRTFSELDTVQLLRALMSRLGMSSSNDLDASTVFTQGKPVVTSILEDLVERQSKEQRLFVLMYLPVLGDYMGEPGTAEWQDFFRAESARLGIVFVDVVEEMRKVPPTEVQSLFDWHNHFSPAGNRFVAEMLLDRLEQNAPALIN